MTPKEKAEELVDKYSFVEIANYTSMFEVKQCALVAVDLHLEELSKMKLIFSYKEIIEYWQEVKQEIQKL
jgi:hypothetical protein